MEQKSELGWEYEEDKEDMDMKEEENNAEVLNPSFDGYEVNGIEESSCWPCMHGNFGT